MIECVKSDGMLCLLQTERSPIGSFRVLVIDNAVHAARAFYGCRVVAAGGGGGEGMPVGAVAQVDAHVFYAPICFAPRSCVGVEPLPPCGVFF